MSYPNILEQNIYSPGLEGKFLLIGTCLATIHPDIVKKFAREWGFVYSVCMEQTHYNTLESKLINILALRKTSKVGFLTADGSPHCVQVHFTAKYIKRMLGDHNIEIEHYVIGDGNKVYKVPEAAVSDSKKFAGLGKEFDYLKI